MAVLYASAIFLGAFLLFLLEPMVAKTVLPLLGGSPAVWNTCVVFFQTVLLAGYGYAHVVSTRVPSRARAALHAAVLALPFFVLPLALFRDASPPATANPAYWLLGTLGTGVGLPFFVLSTTGPLLQRWFAESSHPRASDPYFLYAASNAGSLGGLLAYPLLVEPSLPLGSQASSGASWSQASVWSLGYVAFAFLGWVCALLSIRRSRPSAAGIPAEDRGDSPDLRRRLTWVALAAVPSSAVLGATQYVTSEIAAVPLLWVVPLAVYLLSYVLAFSTRIRLSSRVWGYLFALTVLAIGGSFLASTSSSGFLAPLHVLAVFFLGMTCHRRLAEDRPAAGRLTEFYLLVATGGALGGIFNALAAPLVFSSFAEYPLALAAACFLRPADRMAKGSSRAARVRDLVLLAALAGLTIVVAGLQTPPGFEHGWFDVMVRVVVPSALALGLVARRTPFALGVTCILAAAWFVNVAPMSSLHRERTFFGVHRVTTTVSPPFKLMDDSGRTYSRQVSFRVLIHGSIRHGTQALDPDLRAVPTTYYHPSGPIGQVIGSLVAPNPAAKVALVGLGAGTLAAYGESGQSYTYFEIDPAVIRIARDARFFSYLADSRAKIDVVPGDGRLTLARRQDGEFDLIVLDAFSSDAIPVHLLTREAIAMNVRKLGPHGVLAIHITNGYLRLDRVVGAVAGDLGLACRVRRDAVASPTEGFQGKDASVWAVLAREPSDLGPLIEDARWEEPASDARYLWTDQVSNLFRILKRP